MGAAITKVGHVLLGLQEKIRYLWVYDRRNLILPCRTDSTCRRPRLDEDKGEGTGTGEDTTLPGAASSRSAASASASASELNAHEEEEGADGAAAPACPGGLGLGLVVLSYNINCLFVHHDPAQLQGIVQYFAQLFQLPRSGSSSGSSSGEETPKVQPLLPLEPPAVRFAPDIICVQEAWEEELIRCLLRLAHEHGWHAARPASAKRLFVGEHTGLLTFSQHEITSHSTTIYRARSGSDWLADKGAQYVTIRLQPPPLPSQSVTQRDASVQSLQMQTRMPLHVHLVNTHLNASPDVDVTAGVSSSADIALQQLEQLVECLPAPHLQEGCLLVGDLNLLPNEVLRFLAKFQVWAASRMCCCDVM